VDLAFLAETIATETLPSSSTAQAKSETAQEGDNRYGLWFFQPSYESRCSKMSSTQACTKQYYLFRGPASQNNSDHHTLCHWYQVSKVRDEAKELHTPVVADIVIATPSVCVCQGVLLTRRRYGWARVWRRNRSCRLAEVHFRRQFQPLVNVLMQCRVAVRACSEPSR
jgi:hypothetical protein